MFKSERAKWGQENVCKTMIERSERQWMQSRFVTRCECVRRVWSMRSQERTISFRLWFAGRMPTEGVNF